MGNIWLKAKIWAKVTLFALLSLYAIVFVAKNSDRPVQPWFWFYKEPQTSVLILVLCAFLIGVVGTILLRTTFKTLRQIRELKQRSRADRLEREVEDMKSKASMLRPRPVATTDPSEVSTPLE